MNIPVEFMEYSGEATLIIRGGRIAYASRAADNLLGTKCENRSVRELFGEEIASIQTGNYSAGLSLNGRSCILRSSKLDGMQMFVITPAEHTGSELHRMLISSLNNTLMNISIALTNFSSIPEDMLPPLAADCFTSIHRDYYRLKRLSSNASLAANFFSSSLPFFPLPHNITEVLRSYIEVASDMCPRIDFKLNMPDSLILNFDRQLLLAAFSNLISNCIMHAANCTSVFVSVTASQKTVVITVSDNGCGIAPDRLSGVFSRYTSQDMLSGTGAGLGLTVARAAAETHGGALVLESRENIGTTVKFSLSRSIDDCSSVLGADTLVSEPFMEEVYTSLAETLPTESLI